MKRRSPEKHNRAAVRRCAERSGSAPPHGGAINPLPRKRRVPSAGNHNSARWTSAIRGQPMRVDVIAKAFNHDLAA